MKHTHDGRAKVAKKTTVGHRDGPPKRQVVQRSDRKAANAATGRKCPHRQLCRTGCTGDCD